MFIGNFSLDDLQFVRDPNSVPMLPIIARGKQSPLEAADDLMGIHASAKSKSASQLLRMLEPEFATKPPQAQPTPTFDAIDDAAIPEPIRPAVMALVKAISLASARIRAACNLSSGELRSLIESLPQLLVEEPKIEFSFVNSKPLDIHRVRALIERIDLAQIRAAGSDLMAAVEIAASAMRNQRPIIATPLKLRIGGLPVVIAGTGNDVHTSTDTALLIDLGGNDVYEGRHGAGIGYASVLIDMGGDDVYAEGDASIGCGIFGVGIAWDELGDDTYRCGSATIGAGIGGVGINVNIGGTDDYRGIAITQGCAMYGIGLCLDTAGDDRYSASLYAQGASRTDGIGWLIDRSGNDTYRAGGLSLNSPLFKDVYYSNAQGFSSGFREDTGGVAGGVGLLTDLQGDDAYIAETYAQAASYWYALGSTYDAAGHDIYSAYHYAQSSAMHLCSAYLFDLSGDDNYSMKFGASHAIGHDYAVAMLLDREGSDVYAARDSNPGIGNANGLGIFVDGAGEDRYQGPPGRANAARGSGSLGIFVDMSGQDLYREGLADGNAAVRDTWAAAYDMSEIVFGDSGGGQEVTPIQPIPGSKQNPGDAALKALYARATQWAVGTAQIDTEQAIFTLIEIGLPALKYMVTNHLPSASRLEQRAFVQIASGIGNAGRELIATRIESDNMIEARIALNICIDGSFQECAPYLQNALAKPELQRMAARAVGVSGAKDCMITLLPLCANSDRILALNSLLSLSMLADEQAYGTAEALMYSNDLPIRKAALALAAKFPERALESARARLQSDNERTVRIAIELLAILGTPDALKECGEKLIDARAGVRIQAMLALNGRCPSEYRTFMITLRTDPIAAVRAVAQRIELGR